MSEILPIMLWHLVVLFFLGAGVGYFVGASYARAKTSFELIETYKHLLDYGRATKPVATVVDPPLDAEARATVQISETAHANLAEYLSKEAGVSMEQARREAVELLSSFESTGQLPT